MFKNVDSILFPLQNGHNYKKKKYLFAFRKIISFMSFVLYTRLQSQLFY